MRFKWCCPILLALCATGTTAAGAWSQTIIMRTETNRFGIAELDAQGQEQVRAAALAPIELSGQRLGTKLYVHFKTDAKAQPPQQQQGGFVEILQPRPATGTVEGLLEIDAERPTVTILPRPGSPVWKGEVSMRIHQCRIFEPGRGWSGPLLGMPRFWKWNAVIENGNLRLAFDRTYAAFQANDPLQDLVSALRNIPPDRVIASKPDAQELEMTVINPAPVRREQPWRAQFGVRP